MAFSVSPAVTVTELDATASVVATATTPGAIVGVFRWGPTNERVLISTEEELASIFGKPISYTANTINWSNAETFFAAADFLSYSNSLYVTRVTSATDESLLTGQSVNFTAKYPGELGNAIGVSFVTSADGFETPVFAAESIVSIDEIVYNSNVFTIESTIDYSAQINAGDILQVGTPSIGYQNLHVASVTVDSVTDPIAETTIHTHTITFKNRYNLSELDYNNLSYKRVWGYANVIPLAPSANGMHIVVTDRTGAISGAAGSILEVFEDVSTVANATLDDGTNNYFRNVIKARSVWINISDLSTIGTIGSTATFGYETLIGGADGLGEASISFGAIARGWDLYKEANEVDVSFLIQGKANNSNIANYIVQNVAEYRKDCVAYLSPRLEDAVTPVSNQEKLNNILTYRSGVQNSSYWFMDSGYKYRYDKYNDTYRWVPLNGDTAGLCSRTDPWESPAGYKRGVVKNIVKLAFNPNKAQRDQLFVKDVNPVMTQTGSGTILFGDKTGLGYGSAFNRINVRRLFITVEKAIATAAAQFLFDFNDEFTQTQFRNMVEPYLRDIQGQRGIIDFSVVSDGRINTPDVIDANIFRGNIYIKPARTITEIQLKFVATRTGTEFEEIIGQTI